MRRYLAYLRYVLRHKWHVFWACLDYRVPVWTALLHDWDKFLPDEWLPYARTFYKPDGSKQYVESVDFARAWMLHQHRNKHHWQWWIEVGIPSHNCSKPLPETDYLVWDRGEAQRVIKRNSGTTEWYELIEPYPSDDLMPTPMSDLARREMLADWIGAGRAIAIGNNQTWLMTNTCDWYEKNKDKMKLHSETRAWIEAEMVKIREDFRRRMMLGISQ